MPIRRPWRRHVMESISLPLTGGRSPKILLPILDGASLEDDAELQDKWAALLVSAASRPDEEVRGFSEILRQVTPALAKFLDRAFDETAEAYKTEIKKLTVGANI